MNIYFRYGMTKEKKLFLENKDKNLFSGIILPAHIALDQIDSLPEWLAMNKINYFIDPITYVFSEQTANICNAKGEIRRSYNKYIESLNLTKIDFIKDTLDLKYFETKGKLDEKKISKFVEAILRVHINVKKLDDETKEFIETIKKEDGLEDYPIDIALDSGHNPLFYTSPGFFFNSPKDEWFKLNIKLMEETIKQSGDQKTYGYLPISKSLFSLKSTKEIVENIPNNLDGIIVWFEDFEDTTASENELKFVVSIIKELGKRKLEVINLYGGLFSALLCEIGCSGYSSGLCYDTRRTRDIEPSGGPLPFRYYIPEVNKFMRQSDAESFYRIIKPACDCCICKPKKEETKDEKGNIQVDKFIESFFNYNRSKEGDYAEHEESLKKHFMYATKEQMDKIKKNGVKKYLDEKESIYKKLVKEHGEIIAKMYASHIPKWVKVIREFL